MNTTITIMKLMERIETLAGVTLSIITLIQSGFDIVNAEPSELE